MRRALNALNPPSGPPWELPLEEAPLAFIDLEMTGLDATKDRVVEVCIERVKNGAVEKRLHTLVRPDGGELGNVHIHGIDAAALASAPTFREIAGEVDAILTGAVPIAHGAAWDVAFLDAEMARAGRSDWKIAFWIDTLHLSRRTFALPKHSLDALAVHFGIDRSRAHRADADVAALREVFRRCIAELEPKTPRDIWQVRIAEGKAREQILAECTQAAEHGRPVVVVYRPRAKPPQDITMVIQRVDTSQEPPRIVGYMLPGRGHRDLRADRVLRIDALDAMR